MKKLIILFILVLFLGSVSAIKITEVEMNPEGTDAGNEWIEFYSKEEINLKNYKLINNDGDEITLNGSFSGYYVYIFGKQWLDNSDEKILLYQNGNLSYENILLEDSKNNDLTWQLCNSEWIFKESTKGEKNDCEKTPEEPNEAEEEKEEEENEEEIEIEETQSSEPIYYEEIDKEEEVKLEIIKLNSKDIKTEDNTENSSKNTYAKYGFVVFCILLGFLFILKKRKNYKTEFEENENKEE